MKDLYHAIDALNNIVNEEPPRGRQDGPGTRQGTTPKPKPTGPAAYNSVGDMMKAIATPGRQGVSDPNQSAKNIAAAQPKPAPAAPKPKPAAFTGRPDDARKPSAAPKINPAVPAAGPVRANPINPQAMAATKAAASVVNAPKPAAQAPTPAAVPVPKPKPAEPVAAPSGVPLNPQGGERVTYQSLAKASGIADPNKIRPGQEIKLPGGGTYKVQSGDTLSGIAQNVRLGNIGAPKPAPAPVATTTARAGDTPQQSGGAGGEFGPGTTRTASTTSATPRQVSTVNPAAKPAAADDMMSPDDMMMQPARVAKSNAALAGDVEKVKKAGGGILDKIGAGISSLFKPSDSSVIGRRGRNVARSAPAAAPAGPNAAGSNFATAADGSISRTDNPRQPSDAAPTTRTANRFDRARARMDKARDRKVARGDTTPVSVSDVQNAAAQSRAAVAATAAAPTTRTVRQGVTDPDEKAAIMRQMNRTREMQRLALAAGSTDPDDIRAYVNRMNRTQGTGAAGGPIN